MGCVVQGQEAEWAHPESQKIPGYEHLTRSSGRGSKAGEVGILFHVLSQDHRITKVEKSC